MYFVVIGQGCCNIMPPSRGLFDFVSFLVALSVLNCNLPCEFMQKYSPRE